MKISYPWLALGIGLLVAMILLRFGALDPAAEQALPLLTLLILSEFGFLVTLIAGGLCVRDLLAAGVRIPLLVLLTGNLLLAAGFLWLGLELWPGMAQTALS